MKAKLIRIVFAGEQLIGAHLTRRRRKTSARLKWQIICGRLVLLSDFIKKFGVGGANQIATERVLGMVVRALQHSNEEVRSAAVDLLMELYKLVGHKSEHRALILDHMGDARPYVMKQIKLGNSAEKCLTIFVCRPQSRRFTFVS